METNINDMLREAEEELALNEENKKISEDEKYKIIPMNSLTGRVVETEDKDGKVPVYPGNNMQQLLEEYGKRLGIDASKPVHFQNQRTREMTSQLNATVNLEGTVDDKGNPIPSLHLEPNDVLLISDRGSVAGK